jgi:DNA-binding NarL/FixJ family response regulator
LQKATDVLILCNNRLLRESVARILAKKNDLSLIAALPIAGDAREQISKSGADVVVLDSLQFILEGAACSANTEAIQRTFKCVLIAMQDEPAQFLTAVRSGALGYILEDASAEDVVAAIRAVEQGVAVCPPRMARILFDYIVARATELPNHRTRMQLGLTRREQQLVPLISRGLTNKEIASQLNLSEQTVKNHVHRILRKLGAENRLSVLDVCQTQLLGI